MAVKKGKEVTASAPGSTSSGGKRKKSMCSKPESSGKGKKRRREGVLKFVDDAAVEDEDESDGLSFIDDIVDEDDENELDRGFMTDVKPGIKDAKSSARSRHLPFFLKEENLSIEEHEALINERYSRHVTYDDETKHIKEIFLHSSKDPTIWKVKCMIGHEQQIAFSLFQKFIDLHYFGNKLPISSVFALEHVKGCVYVEAEKEADVTEACRGFCTLYTSKKTVVTKDEIPRLLSAKNTLSVLSVGTWVRVKSGNYKGDLAQVVGFDDQRKRAMVKLVPRIDLQALSKKFGGGVSLKDSGIPTPRLISSRELEDFRPHIQIKCDRLTGENFEILDGMMLKEGYLYKKVSVASLSWLGVQPSRDELLKFEAPKMDDAEDLNWLSLVYGERKKARLEESNYEVETNRGSGYQLHDLVLFGRKDFGVIIGIKGDSIQILKGDTEGPQLATVLRKDIRTTCADKMFTASDCHRKTISINDTVKVLEGPLEGREGTVRHMYKGTLFLYDETQTENCGFFCAKSQLCLNIKQSKSSKNDKIGSTSSYVHLEEPMTTGEPSESRDFDSGVVARRPRRMDFDSPFSVGQTVRIRIGILKGYLCRVISIYRSKATVKLDSLAKVMTVNFTDLSEANIKNFGSSARDTSTMISSDQFGSQDKPTDDRWGAPSGNNAWNSGLSATARDSWPGCSTSAVPVSSHNDDGKGDNARGTDPWSSNLRSKDPEQTKDMDCWDKGNMSTGGQSSAWNSSAGDVSGSIKEQTGGWEKDAGGWNKSGTDVWDKAKPINEDAVRSWDHCSLKDGKQGNSSDVASDRWEKKTNNIQMDSWTVKESSGATKGTSASAWTSTQVVNDHSDSWDTKGEGITRNNDAWGKALASQSKKVPSADNVAWEKLLGNASSGPSKDQTDVWDIKGKSVRGNEADTWCKSPVSRNRKDAHDDSGGWGISSARSSWNNSTLAGGKQDGIPDNVECRVQQNSAHVDLSNKWDKPANSSYDQSDNWGKSNNKPFAGAFGDKTFGSAFKKWDTMSSVHGDKSSSWEKPKVSSGGFSDNWSKARRAGDQETGDWQKAGTDAHGQSDRWGKSESSGNDQASRWEKQADTREETNAQGDWGGNWNKPNHFEGGRGYGQGRGRGRDTKGGDRDHFGGDQGSTWGRGRGQNSDWNRQGNWSQPRDFNGDQGCSWGSGKNESGGNDRGSWDRSNNFNARGNKQEGGQGQDNSNYPSAFGRGDGRGWGRDQSSDWRNEQENRSGGFSGNSFGSWGNEQQGSWGKSKSFDTNEGSGGADDQGNGWGRGKSVGCDTGGSEKRKSFNRNEGSDWNKGRQTSDETYGITKQSSGWNNEGRNWNEAKKASVEQSGWNQEAAVNESSGAKDKWNAPKPSGNQFSWNDKGNTWNKPERHGFNQPTSSNNKLIENVNSENETSGAKSVWDKTPKLSDDGKGWGSPAAKSSGWTNSATKPTDAGGSWEKMKASGDGGSCWNWKSDSSEVGKVAAGSGSSWDRPKSYSTAENSGWNNDEGKSWDKPKEPAGNESSGWGPSCGRGGRSGNRNHGGWSYDGGQSEWSGNRGGDRGGFDSGGRGGRSGNWNRGGRSYDGGESSEWSGSHGGGRGRGRGSGRNFSSDMGNQQNSYSRGESGGWRKDESSSWNQGKSFSREQSTGGFKGFSCQGGGWSTEKGILETPKSKADWPSSSWGSGSAVKEAGIGTWNQKYDFGGKGSGWNTGPESSKDVSFGQAGEWNKGNATEKGSWGPPRTGADGQTAGWEKGSGSAGRETGADKWSQTKGSDGNNKLGWNTGSTSSKDATNTRERGRETKNRNAGEEVWNQEETQPTGSNADGNPGNAWEKSSGSWKKPKDGNSGGKGGW